MDKTTYKKIFSEAISYGLKKRLSLEQAEDFAQRFILARYIKNTDQKINEAYIDFLRYEYGDIRRLKGADKRKALKTYVELNDEILGDIKISLNMISLKVLFEKRLREKDKQVLLMRIKGYTLQEISDHFQVTPASIHQRLKRIEKLV